MSDTCTSPSNELWLLDTDSWLRDVRGACWGLEGAEEGGVDGRWWEELWADDVGHIGVNAEAGGRVEDLGVELVNADCAAEWETAEVRVKDWVAAGEVRGLVDGQIDDESVDADWAV